MNIFKKIKNVSEVKEILKNNPNEISDNIINVFQNFMALKDFEW